MPAASSPFGEKYAFGYGRIGVLQHHLLSTSDLDRLLGSHNEQQLRQILSEIRFTSHVMPLENLSDLVPAMEKWLRGEVEKMAPPDQAEVFHILWLREDMPVIAFYLKKFHGFTSDRSNEPVTAVTSYDVTAIRDLILEGRDDDEKLPEDFVRFIETIKARTDITPQEIDSETAQFVAHRQMDLARASGSKIVRRYVSHLIDLQNIRTAHRLEKGQLDRFHFMEGGEIDIDMITSGLDKLSLLIHRSSLPDAVAKSIVDGDKSSVILERGLNKGLAHDIAEMRGIPLSIEPIFSFAIIALSHILLIRTILIGKAARLSAEDIRTMLPPIFSTSFAAA